MVFDQEEKKEVVWNFYNNLLGTAKQRDLTLDLQAFHREPADLTELEGAITEEEVWNTVKALPSDKAPGQMVSLDGFTKWPGMLLKWISWLLFPGLCREMSTVCISSTQHI